MVWDPFGTLGRVLWIGGGQWAGKSTVARLLAARYGVTAYHYDYQSVHAHEDRLAADRARHGLPVEPPDPERMWVDTTPADMAAEVIAGFPSRFEWVLDDLRALVSGRPIIAEGWGLRPELVAPIVDSLQRMVVMVPSPGFRRRQARDLPRAREVVQPVSDPVRAQENRLARDQLVAEDAVRTAARLGVRVIEVDGSLDAEAVAGVVARHFASYLAAAGNPT
jgi:2-phosphoglycerate kinase